MTNNNHRLYGHMYSDASNDAIYEFSNEDEFGEYLQEHSVDYPDWLVLMNRMSLSDEFIARNIDRIDDCGLYVIIRWQSIGCDILELLIKRLGESEQFWFEIKHNQKLTFKFWRMHMAKLFSVD